MHLLLLVRSSREMATVNVELIRLDDNGGQENLAKAIAPQFDHPVFQMREAIAAIGQVYPWPSS